jgi:hypothetical protein
MLYPGTGCWRREVFDFDRIMSLFGDVSFDGRRFRSSQFLRHFKPADTHRQGNGISTSNGTTALNAASSLVVFAGLSSIVATSQRHESNHQLYRE